LLQVVLQKIVQEEKQAGSRSQSSERFDPKRFYGARRYRSISGLGEGWLERMKYLLDTNIVIYYFNGLTADEALHQMLADDFRSQYWNPLESNGSTQKKERWCRNSSFITHYS